MNDDSATFVYSHSRMRRPFALRGDDGRRFLLGAICVAICAIMLAPLVLSISASLKSASEAAAVPPTYFTHHLSLDSYQRLWRYQAGLPTYLMNSGGTALLTIAFCLLLTNSRRLCARAFPRARQGIYLHLLAPCADCSLSIPVDPHFLHVRSVAPDQHATGPCYRPHDDPNPVQPLHNSQQF